MMTLKELEYLHILDCLIKNEFDRHATAKELGISVRTVGNKIKDMRINGDKILTVRDVKNIKKENAKAYNYNGMATNEERLAHADSMINRNYL